MRFLLFPALGLIALGACKDLPRQTLTEVAPEDAVESAAPSAREHAAQESTICAAYGKQLTASRAALAAAPGDASLQETVATFEMVIADACN